jgi:beta-barrel assembly-enhancing protease
MRAKIYRDLLILLGVFFIAWLGFTFIKFQPTVPSFTLSIEDEEKLGDLLTEAAFSGMDEIDSPALDSAMAKISYRLSNAVDSQTYNYTFHTVKNDQINAFATLGGHIYVFSGLIKITESPEELAAVIAHEMGHVEERHVVNKMARDFGMTILVSAFTGGDPNVIAELLEFSIANVFSRQQEREADIYGLKLLEQANIDPIHMANAFVKLKKEGQKMQIPAFLQSHPDIDARISSAMTYSTKSDFENRPFDLNWAIIVASIK